MADEWIACVRTALTMSFAIYLDELGKVSPENVVLVKSAKMPLKFMVVHYFRDCSKDEAVYYMMDVNCPCG